LRAEFLGFRHGDIFSIMFLLTSCLPLAHGLRATEEAPVKAEIEALVN
jgi:hypothetical protein